MTREEARKAAEVMIAYVGGAQLQCREVWLEDDDDEKHYGPWCDFIDENDVHCNWSNYDYRVKPKSTYRPFKNAEECWEEMKKHEPFGWLRENYFGDVNYHSVDFLSDALNSTSRNGHSMDFDELFENQTFADGTPFGIKVEEQENG